MPFVAAGSKARHSMLLADSVDGRAEPPELREADYVREVLARPNGTTEADIEEELLAKAAALGIELPTSGRSSAQEQRTLEEKCLVPCAGPQLTYEVPAGSDDVADAIGPAPQVPDHAAAVATPTTATAQTEGSAARRRSKSPSFSQYDRYISQVDPALDQSKFLRPNHDNAEWSAGIVVKSSTRRGVRGFTRSIAAKLMRRRPSPSLPMPCICCREDYTTDTNTLHTLPCGHCYCRDCLAIMVEQSITDESKMPPRCCTQPIPSAIIKLVLPRDKQLLFLKAVLQYSTPWDTRLFCPNTTCGEFIPPPATKTTPNQKPPHNKQASCSNPFETRCPTCHTLICTMCKRPAHQPGQDCPSDPASDAVLRLGERAGWRRCYRCRSLVELAQGCTHMTCRCKAQFCYICGAVWDPAVGCPNFCNGEEELERRRAEEEVREKEREVERLAREQEREMEERAREEAERRTGESDEFRGLGDRQREEMERFLGFERGAKEAMGLRQAAKKQALGDRYAELLDRMRERHAKTEQHLEDRQVLAEIELQALLEEKEKKVRLKLRYMEDYCNNPPTPPDSDSTDTPPRRQVTDRDREQLRQQHREHTGLQKRHASQIHGLREKQAKGMEELMERHEREMDTLVARRAEEMEDLAAVCSDEEELLLRAFAERRARLERRWEVEVRVLRGEMEKREGVGYGGWPVPRWPEGGVVDMGFVVEC